MRPLPAGRSPCAGRRAGAATAGGRGAAAVARAAAGGKKKSKFSSRAEWLLSFVKRFNPKEERDAKVTVLDFEKPLAELDKRIREVRDVASENWRGRLRAGQGAGAA